MCNTKEQELLPKATAEQAKKYDELVSKIKAIAPGGNYDLASELYREKYAMEEAFDWNNIEFSDPDTGKKGVKDITGKILIPAIYDGLTLLGSYVDRHTFPQSVVKNGKFGIVAADGSGRVFSEFKFDFLVWQWGTMLFQAYWDGDKQHYGFVDMFGHVICPNILTSHNDIPINDIMVIKCNDKYGLIDINSYQTVLPEYDAIDLETEDYVVFHKNGQTGYITDKGEFVTIEQYEEDEEGEYDDANFINAFSF